MCLFTSWSKQWVSFAEQFQSLVPELVSLTLRSPAAGGAELLGKAVGTCRGLLQRGVRGCRVQRGSHGL